MVLFTLWAIWWVRRPAIHDENSISTHKFITKYLEEIEVPVKLKREVQPTGEPSRRNGKWIPPEPGWCKINVDGGFSRDGRRGGAAARGEGKEKNICAGEGQLTRPRRRVVAPLSPQGRRRRGGRAATAGAGARSRKQWTRVGEWAEPQGGWASGVFYFY